MVSFVKIQMMTKNRSFGSSVTHVTFGTTKLVLQNLGHHHSALQMMQSSGTVVLVLP